MKVTVKKRLRIVMLWLEKEVRETLRGETALERAGSLTVYNKEMLSSLLQVPSTKGARLLRVLIRQESTIARISGYNVKMCKKSGNPFARLFQRVYTLYTQSMSLERLPYLQEYSNKQTVEMQDQ